MNKLFTTVVLALTLTVPAAAFAGDKASDASSNVDTKKKTSGAHPASPGTVGAMNNSSGGSSFTASEADQKKNLTTSK